MAAVTGEPLPEAARADAVLLAEYRSAETDVAVLRKQLEIIADALADPAPHPAPAPPRPRSRYRPLRLALNGLAAAVAGTVLVGLGWLVVRATDGAADITAGTGADKAQQDAKAGGPFGSPDFLACARLVAEGEVTGTRPVPGTGQERVTLQVSRSYIPARSEAEVTFVIPAAAGLDEGQRALVAIRRGSASPEEWLVGEEAIAAERPLLLQTLPRARTTPCP
ncbi:hypothetical protein IPT68_12885 [Streptomyces chromofuscus]|uniref:Uncharacterized protein n=2 Tax=Streptomyces chromofuscus TaxID=42881 RepID=A0A7M2TIS3_STRCW|nr:hypothetical protein IPT68_12885 [Streptomyces chromofuscus]